MRAEISRSMTVAELVRGLYGERTLSRKEQRRVERALLEANPELEGRDTVPARTVVDVPDVGAGRALSSLALGIRVVGPAARVAPSPRVVAITRAKATVAILKAAKQNDRIAERLAGAGEEAKRRLDDEEALQKNLELVAERLWKDVDALVAVLRDEPVEI